MSNDGIAGDALGELILSKGLATNAFLLDLDNGLKVPDDFELPAPWNLPSRMFQFPIETHPPENGHPRNIGLLHPALAEHPYVKHVEAALGITIPREPAMNDCGYTKADTATWWHAVDLACSGHWRELIETAEFTAPDCMLRAVGLALGSLGRKSDSNNRQALREARGLLAWLGSKEPECRSASIRVMDRPSPFHDGEGTRCPINSRCADRPYAAEAWAFIHGIEDGWMTYDRRGYLQWSELGQIRYFAGDGESFKEKSGQHAFAF